VKLFVQIITVILALVFILIPDPVFTPIGVTMLLTLSGMLK